jgi:hypothetical protein
MELKRVWIPNKPPESTAKEVIGCFTWELVKKIKEYFE